MPVRSPEWFAGEPERMINRRAATGGRKQSGFDPLAEARRQWVGVG